MLSFDRNKAATVARHTQNSFATFDAAYLSTLQLAASFIEAKKASDLPEQDGQRLMQSVHNSAGNLLAGRAEMVAATAMLRRFQRRSNQAETDFGCPGPGPWTLTGQVHADGPSQCCRPLRNDIGGGRFGHTSCYAEPR